MDSIRNVHSLFLIDEKKIVGVL